MRKSTRVRKCPSRVKNRRWGLQPGRLSGPRKRPEFRAEPLDVAVLVVGRDEDEETGGRHRCDVETTSIEGRGNISLPPAARYAASRSTRPARKCHGKTRK